MAGLCWLDYQLGTPQVGKPDSAARPGLVLLPVALLLTAAAAGEFLWLTATQHLAPLRSVVYGGNLLVVAASGYSALMVNSRDAAVLTDLGWPILALMAATIAAFVGEMRRYQKPGGVTVNLALAVFSLVYIGVQMGSIVQLRVLGGNAAGLVQLVALVAVVKMGDIGAYTVGRLIGRHKLAPTLSPGKDDRGGRRSRPVRLAGCLAGLSLVGPGGAASLCGRQDRHSLRLAHLRRCCELGRAGRRPGRIAAQTRLGP